MTYADQLARLRVAVATGHLAEDLGRWALDQLAARAGDAERIELRNLLLRAAAALLPGSTWARARRLSGELLAMERRRGPADEMRALLAEALEIDPGCPRSHRQLLRILGGDSEGGGDVTTAGRMVDPWRRG